MDMKKAAPTAANLARRGGFVALADRRIRPAITPSGGGHRGYFVPSVIALRTG
jgi:hypothetical protein